MMEMRVFACFLTRQIKTPFETVVSNALQDSSDDSTTGLAVQNMQNGDGGDICSLLKQ